MATFTKLPSGSWRVQVRRKERYIGETFLRRDHAREWATEIEHEVDRGKSAVPGAQGLQRRSAISSTCISTT